MSFFARMAAKSEIRVRDLLIARVHNAALLRLLCSSRVDDEI